MHSAHKISVAFWLLILYLLVGQVELIYLVLKTVGFLSSMTCLSSLSPHLEGWQAYLRDGSLGISCYWVGRNDLSLMSTLFQWFQNGKIVQCSLWVRPHVIPKRERHMKGQSWKAWKMDMGFNVRRPLRGLGSYLYPGLDKDFFAEHKLKLME